MQQSKLFYELRLLHLMHANLTEHVLYHGCRQKSIGRPARLGYRDGLVYSRPVRSVEPAVGRHPSSILELTAHKAFMLATGTEI